MTLSQKFGMFRRAAVQEIDKCLQLTQPLKRGKAEQEGDLSFVEIPLVRGRNMTATPRRRAAGASARRRLTSRGGEPEMVRRPLYSTTARPIPRRHDGRPAPHPLYLSGGAGDRLIFGTKFGFESKSCREGA